MGIDLEEKPPSLNDVYRRHVCGTLLRPRVNLAERLYAITPRRSILCARIFSSLKSIHAELL